MTITLRERERERERQNRRNRRNLPSRFRRGGCERCGRVGILLLDLDTDLCFECFLDQVISEIKEDIKSNGLEATRTAWKEDKPQFERIIREAKEQDSSIGKKFEGALQEIESLLYPERNKGSSGGIWVLVVVIIAGVGIIVAWVLYRNKRETKK